MLIRMITLSGNGIVKSPGGPLNDQGRVEEMKFFQIFFEMIFFSLEPLT